MKMWKKYACALKTQFGVNGRKNWLIVEIKNFLVKWKIQNEKIMEKNK